MAMFKGFKPQGLQKIANSMGYTGSLEGFDSYLQQNPDKQNMMNMYNQRAIQMAQGGAVRKMQVGGLPKAPRQDEGMSRNAKQFQSAVPTLNPEATLQRLPEAPRQETDRAYGTKPNRPGLTRAMGEDGIGPQPNITRLVTQAVGEDGSGDAIARPIGTTRAMGEDGTGPRPLIANRPVGTTRAVGEDGNWGDSMVALDPKILKQMQRGAEDLGPSINQPIAKTMAVGEDDGDMGGKLIGRLPPDMPPDLAKLLRRGGEDFPPVRPPIAKTMAAGEDDGFPTQPKQTQAYVPTLGEGPGQVPAYGSSDATPPVDPYADYRQNVERFPETGTFKNPEIQPSFETMTEELKRNLGNNPSPERLKERSDKVLDYVKNVYSGPLYREDGKTFTEEFKQYAKDSGITIKDSFLNVQEGSPIATTPGYLPSAPMDTSQPGIQDVAATLAQTGAIPVGAVTQPELIQREDGQFIDPNTGQLAPAPTATTTIAGTQTADPAQQVTATKMEATQSAPAIQTAVQANQAAQTDPNDPRAKVTAAQQTTSSVGDLSAAQGNATLMENPTQREIQDGELISGVADAEKASKFTEQIQAATATPSEKATVQGQLAQLTANFDMSNPPPWAAGALRGIQAQLQQRGLGASSIAGQALIQGALESALPIAQADAQTQAQFESQNLSNRQQRAMLAAQQRATFLGQEFDQEFQARVQNASKIADIANMNFNAEQQVALENSRITNTMNLQNLSNNQAMVMAEAAALSQLDMANLSNNQQAAVQNAQNFLQMEMANLTNEQQTAMFNAQAINQAILTDQAATNAAAQFNATSDNQTKQFMASLANQVSQFNATQVNAQNQFNAGELNTLERFNAEIANQRDQFNATNQLAIAQNNAVWRREIATADTAAINRANELNAKAVLDVSNAQYDNLWSFYSDTMEWAWKSSESEAERIKDMTIANINADTQAAALQRANATSKGIAVGSLVATLGAAAITKWCWVAREVYGTEDLKWLDFRQWMLYKAPSWLRWLYKKYGESFANFIKDKPFIKDKIRKLMDKVICP
jgi:hypothetical protein